LFDKTLFDKTLFDKTLFDKTLFDKTLFDKTLFDKMVFVKTVFDKTVFDKTLFDKTLFDKTSFTKCRLMNRRSNSNCDQFGSANKDQPKSRSLLTILIPDSERLSVRSPRKPHRERSRGSRCLSYQKLQIFVTCTMYIFYFYLLWFGWASFLPSF
jgi:uncharacterized protein YqgQ